MTESPKDPDPDLELTEEELKQVVGGSKLSAQLSRERRGHGPWE
jgi:bacteriocin-like protein